MLIFLAIACTAELQSADQQDIVVPEEDQDSPVEQEESQDTLVLQAALAEALDRIDSLESSLDELADQVASLPEPEAQQEPEPNPLSIQVQEEDCVYSGGLSYKVIEVGILPIGWKLQATNDTLWDDSNWASVTYDELDGTITVYCHGNQPGERGKKWRLYWWTLTQ